MLRPIQQTIRILTIAICALAWQYEICQAALVYSASHGDGTINKIDENGVVSIFASGLNGPSQIVVDHNGNVFVSSIFDGTVRKYSSAGTDLGIFAQLTDGNGNSLGTSGMAIDSAGNLYVGASDLGSAIDGDIHKYASNGDDLGVFAHLKVDGRFATFFSMTFDHSGNLWATDFSDAGVYKFAADGTFEFRTFPGELGIAVSPQGGVFTTDTSGGIDHFNENGVVQERYQLINLPFTSGIAFDADGTILYSDFLSGDIRRIAQDGTDLGLFASGFNLPLGLAFAPISAVPEPSSLMLIGIGAIAFIVTHRKRCKGFRHER